MKAGDSFIPAKFDSHLWVILSDPSLDSDKIVIVNFTTNTKDEEQHCILKKDDHPFVKHNTAVRYRDAKIVSDDQLDKLLNLRQLKSSDALSVQLLRRLRDGAAKSDFLPEGCREILDDQGLI